MPRSKYGLLVIAALLLAETSLPAQDYRVDIGYTALVAQLGGATPDGTGVPIAQIEATDTSPDMNTFLPNLMDPTNFNQMIPYVLVNRSGGGGFSGHATGAVGGYFYGLHSIAQGIRHIDAWRADDFPPTTAGYLQSGLLQTQSVNLPQVQTARVESHAYVGTFGNDALDSEILRRFDFMIRRDNVVSIVGTNVGGGIDNLMASAYNSITVGTNPLPRPDLPVPWTSVGPTTFEGAGRSKPDLVVPADATEIFPSNSVAIAAAASALLVQTANGISANAQRAETIKSVLMTGATTEQFDGLAMPWTRVNNGTFVEPLDRRFGAGQLNILNSYRILTFPQQGPSNNSTVNKFGWDYNTANPNVTNRYFIDITSTSTASITAVWMREITATQPTPESNFVFTPSLAHINIRLFTAIGFNEGTLVDESVSPIDNVQHLLDRGLAPGRYEIEVTTDVAENYALSWDFRTAVPEPGTILLTVVGLAGATMYGYRRRGRHKRRMRQGIQAV